MDFSFKGVFEIVIDLYTKANIPDNKIKIEGIIMATGTVKWFNPAKGYGFIEPEGGGADAFVHISAVERAGLSTLNEGQKVSYDLEPGKNGKSSAENLTVVD